MCRHDKLFGLHFRDPSHLSVLVGPVDDEITGSSNGVNLGVERVMQSINRIPHRSPHLRFPPSFPRPDHKSVMVAGGSC